MRDGKLKHGTKVEFSLDMEFRNKYFSKQKLNFKCWREKKAWFHFSIAPDRKEKSTFLG